MKIPARARMSRAVMVNSNMEGIITGEGRDQRIGEFRDWRILFTLRFKLILFRGEVSYPPPT